MWITGPKIPVFSALDLGTKVLLNTTNILMIKRNLSGSNLEVPARKNI
jgi:hypothetical protein